MRSAGRGAGASNWGPVGAEAGGGRAHQRPTHGLPDGPIPPGKHGGAGDCAVAADAAGAAAQPGPADSPGGTGSGHRLRQQTAAGPVSVLPQRPFADYWRTGHRKNHRYFGHFVHASALRLVGGLVRPHRPGGQKNERAVRRRGQDASPNAGGRFLARGRRHEIQAGPEQPHSGRRYYCGRSLYVGYLSDLLAAGGHEAPCPAGVDWRRRPAAAGVGGQRVRRPAGLRFCPSGAAARL